NHSSIMRSRIAATIALAIATPSTSRADDDCPMDTTFIPLPVWATDPNEGSTWGVMPVIMHVCRTDRRTSWLLAPSATWNSIVHYTATLRWFFYPSEDTTVLVQASASTRIQYNVLLQWSQLPIEPAAWTQQLTVR